MHTEMHLILQSSEKSFSRRCRRIIIKSSRIDISNLLVEPSLRHPDLSDLLELLLKILLCKDTATLLQPFLIHHPSLDSIILHNRISPSTELHRPLIIHLEANSNNHLEIIMVDGPRYSTRTFILNYQVFLIVAPLWHKPPLSLPPNIKIRNYGTLRFLIGR